MGDRQLASRNAPRDPESGHALRELRKAKGLSQGRLAAFLGVSVRAVKYWEQRGCPGTGLGSIENIARVLEGYDA